MLPGMADKGKKKGRGKHQPMGLEILYEDRDIIVVNKAAGLCDEESKGRPPISY
jgi:23S rRNA-/tRNA-specific pseudouridylate synthase